MMTPSELATWALLGAGLGRLVAKDSLLTPVRNRAVRALGVYQIDGQAEWADDLGAECRKGIYPLESDPGVTMAAKSATEAKLVEGLTCPSCVSWHAIVWARLLLGDHRGVFTKAWWRDTFACWAAASILTRIGG